MKIIVRCPGVVENMLKYLLDVSDPSILLLPW